LESFDKSLPYKTLVKRIAHDLILIRSKFPVVAEVMAKEKSQAVVGRLMIVDNKEKILDTNSIKTEESLDDNKIVWGLLQKPYHIGIVDEILKQDFEKVDAIPNQMFGSWNFSSVTLKVDPYTGKNNYAFVKVSGHCPLGCDCINKQFWLFTVSPETDSVDLIRQSETLFCTSMKEIKDKKLVDLVDFD